MPQRLRQPGAVIDGADSDHCRVHEIGSGLEVAHPFERVFGYRGLARGDRPITQTIELQHERVHRIRERLRLVRHGKRQ
jgi:hypothetical protein